MGKEIVRDLRTLIDKNIKEKEEREVLEVSDFIDSFGTEISEALVKTIDDSVSYDLSFNSVNIEFLKIMKREGHTLYEENEVDNDLEADFSILLKKSIKLLGIPLKDGQINLSIEVEED